MIWFLASAAAVCLFFGGFVVVALRRATRAAVKASPTPAEAQIHVKAERARAALPLPDPEAVHRESNEEVENEANDRTSLVPPR